MRNRLLILGFLALTGLLPGCQDRRIVKVSGAVERPGEYVFEPQWFPAQYVTAAGGYLTEADTTAACVMRVREDTTGAMTIAYLLHR